MTTGVHALMLQQGERVHAVISFEDRVAFGLQLGAEQLQADRIVVNDEEVHGGPFFRLLVDRVASFGDGGELVGQFTCVDRFQKVGIAPGSQGGGLRILFGIAGDSDDVDVAHVGVSLELAGQREAIHARQVEVEEDELRAVFFDGGEGLLGSLDRTDIVSGGAQDEIRELEIRSVVFDDEDFRCGFSVIDRLREPETRPPGRAACACQWAW